MELKWFLVATGVVVLLVVLWLVVSGRKADEETVPDPVPWCVVDSPGVDVSWEGSYPGRLLIAAGRNVIEVYQGNVIWCLEAGGDVGGCSWLSEDVVLFWVPSNGVYVVSRDGVLLWRYLDASLCCACPLIEEGTDGVVIGRSSGEVCRVGEDGKVWETDVSAKIEGVGVDLVSWVSSWPGGYVATLGGASAVVLVQSDGALGWRRPVEDPSRASMLSSGDLLVCSGGRVVELGEGGESVWSGGEDFSSAFQAKWLPCGVVLVCGEGEVRGVSAEGGVLWKAGVPGIECADGSL